LGIEHYGLWMLVSTITLGMNVLNIGVGDTNIRLISKYRASNDLFLIKRVFRFNFSLSILLCFAAVLLGFVFYTFSFISIFYKSSDYTFANTVLLLASAAAGIKFIEISILSVFKAFERFDINSKLVLVSKNSVMLLNIGLVLLGYDLISIFISTVIVNFFNIILQLGVLTYFERKIVSLPSLFFFREKLDYVNYNLWYWLQSVIALLGFSADKLAVAYFTDVKTLGYYSIASLIGTQIHNFFLAFGSFIFPRVSFKTAVNSNIASLYYAARSFVALPGWCITCFLLLFGDFIFKLWLGSETFYNSIYFIKLYLVFESGMLLIIIPYYFISGTHFIRLNSLFEFIIRSSHFLLMMAGYYINGVNGIIYGLIISTFLNIPFQYFYFHKKVIPGVGSFESFLVILPVFIMLGLIISGNVFFQLSLVLCLALSAKIIYFDPARQYSKNILLLRSLFTKLESK
jgi:O-antigen/teichoic acid export membrane protein